MAGFNTAITGLKAASTNLDVTGNNIANSSTVGFKTSRTEFGDIYATAVVGAGSSNVAGSGVTVTDIAQNFQAGTTEFTSNNLDLAINGSGFFQLDDGQGTVTYTRAGAFELDKDGYVVSKSGKYLQGYGLDSQGNRLPIGNLAVDQKESQPKATEAIGLSFNIDDASDANLLTLPYDKDVPSSFTYSTTVRTFDSLGNEHTIKYNIVEQPAIREVQTLDFSSATPGMTGLTRISGVDVDLDILQKGAGVDPDMHTLGEIRGLVLADGLDDQNPGQSATITIGATPITITGLDNTADALGTPAALATALAANSAQIVSDYNATGPTAELIDVVVDPDDPANLLFRYNNGGTSPLVTAIVDGNEADATAVATGATVLTDYNAEVAKLLDGDNRLATIEISGSSGEQIELRFKASATDVDDVQVRNPVTGGLLTDVSNTSANLQANEVHTYDFNSAAFSPVTGNLLAETRVTIGGVELTFDAGASTQTLQGIVESSQAAIIDANPDVLSVQFDSSDQLVVTFKPESGDVKNATLSVVWGDVTPAGPSPTPVMELASMDAGDNSYQGVYRMYAYLNGTELLNIGKGVDPGEAGFDTINPSQSQTEVGSVLLGFDPSSGFLNSVNGTSFAQGAVAPALSIQGADPANTLTEINLDLSGSTQFASASIVKSATQDGYTKGDLIGVSFAESGEMVASFSNGEKQNLGVVAFATFENQSGLQPAGDTEWGATLTSGSAVLNPPGTGLNGSLRSAALEGSNVDLSTELVRLIEAQRNFQANSKTLETLNTVTQSILQI